MVDGSPGVRARNSLLGAAVGDVYGGLGLQPVLFAPALRLSEAGWTPLATCEAIARAGGCPTPAAVTHVVHEWRAAGRPVAGAAAALDDAPERTTTLGALRAAPLAFVLPSDSRADVRLVLDMAGPLRDEGAGVQALTRALQLCLEAPAVPSSLASLVSASCDPLVAEALAIAAEWPDDLAGALGALSRGPAASVTGAILGMLLGAGGAVIPWSLLEDIAEVHDVDLIADRFAQLVSAALA